MIPRKGLRFIHARVVDINNVPMKFQVTRIAQGTVYYKEIVFYEDYYKLEGNSLCCPVEEFPKWCKEIIV